jgi:hypothetical protein
MLVVVAVVYILEDPAVPVVRVVEVQVEQVIPAQELLAQPIRAAEQEPEVVMIILLLVLLEQAATVDQD